MLEEGNQHEFQFAGGLVFDEIKLQEGLCWDQKTDTLLGFADSSVLSSEATVRPAGKRTSLCAGAGQLTCSVQPWLTVITARSHLAQRQRPDA